MNGTLQLKGVTFSPPLFCAPMAGITHCAFRRFLAEYGGYGGLFTEMLSGRSIPAENPHVSTYLRKTPGEGLVFYQLLLRDDRRLDEVVAKIVSCEPAGIDLNCACPAPDARFQRAGGELLEDPPRLELLLRSLRRLYAGPLTVKVRLGRSTPGWETRLADRFRLFADCGVDAIIVHPRFAEDKLKRPARLELLPWLVSLTSLPLIANGDIVGPDTVQDHPDWFAGVRGIMIGRMAILRPWIFRDWAEPAQTVPDYLDIWQRFHQFVMEDFPPEKAILRLKQFTVYYARNFSFGHTLASGVQSAPDLGTLRDRALRFLERRPQLSVEPCLSSV